MQKNIEEKFFKEKPEFVRFMDEAMSREPCQPAPMVAENGDIIEFCFEGHVFPVIRSGRRLFVACKPIAEAIGLSWSAQFELLNRDPVLSQVIRMIRMTSKGRDGKTYQVEMLCLPIEYLNGWLFKVDVSRLKDEDAQVRLIRYQERCYPALFEHFFGGGRRERGLSEAEIRRIIREELRTRENEEKQAIRLARELGYAEGVKAALEAVRRYEQCNHRNRPAHFLIRLMRYEALGLKDWEVRRLLKCSEAAVRRGRKVLRELGVTPEMAQLPLFQKNGKNRQLGGIHEPC